MINDSWIASLKRFQQLRVGQKFLSFIKCLNFTFVLRICAGSFDFAGTKIREQKTNNLSRQIRELRCIWAVSYVLKLIYSDLKSLEFNPIHQERTVKPLDRVLGTVAVSLGRY